VDLTIRLWRLDRAHPITFSARRHAAACGAGSGGSWGASGGVSGFEGVGTVSLRIIHSFLTRIEVQEVSRSAIGISVGVSRRLV
jgi:hypothetical protein